MTTVTTDEVVREVVPELERIASNIGLAAVSCRHVEESTRGLLARQLVELSAVLREAVILLKKTQEGTSG